MILLSALLASLSGLVAGERMPVRAQVELSAAVAAVQGEAAQAHAAPRAVHAQPVRVDRGPVLPQARAAARIERAGTRLAIKQSWLF